MGSLKNSQQPFYSLKCIQFLPTPFFWKRTGLAVFVPDPSGLPNRMTTLAAHDHSPHTRPRATHPRPVESPPFPRFADRPMRRTRGVTGFPSPSRITGPTHWPHKAGFAHGVCLSESLANLHGLSYISKTNRKKIHVLPLALSPPPTECIFFLVLMRNLIAGVIPYSPTGFFSPSLN